MSKGRALIMAVVAAAAVAVAAGVLVAIESGRMESEGSFVPIGAQGTQNHVINVTDSVSVGDKR